MHDAENRDSRVSAPAADEDDLIPFKAIAHYAGYVLRSAARHKAIFACCMVILLAATAALVRVMPRQYQTETTILAERNPLGAFTNPSVNREWDAPLRAASILSRSMAFVSCRVSPSMTEQPWQTPSRSAAAAIPTVVFTI